MYKERAILKKVKGCCKPFFATLTEPGESMAKEIPEETFITINGSI